jgi:hypothetical protein
MWQLLVILTIYGTCPFSPTINPFNRPPIASHPSESNEVCKGWSNQICCDSSVLGKIKTAQSSTACQGCNENLENYLCYVACNPNLTQFNFKNVPISSLYCAASQLSCGTSVCSKDGLFTQKLQEIFPGAELMLYEDLVDMRPVAAECKKSLVVLPDSTNDAAASQTKVSTRIWVFVLISSCLVLLFIKRKNQKQKTYEEIHGPWANLNIDTRL